MSPITPNYIPEHHDNGNENQLLRNDAKSRGDSLSGNKRSKSPFLSNKRKPSLLGDFKGANHSPVVWSDLAADFAPKERKFSTDSGSPASMKVEVNSSFENGNSPRNSTLSSSAFESSIKQEKVSPFKSPTPVFDRKRGKPALLPLPVPKGSTKRPPDDLRGEILDNVKLKVTVRGRVGETPTKRRGIPTKSEFMQKVKRLKRNSVAMDISSGEECHGNEGSFWDKVANSKFAQQKRGNSLSRGKFQVNFPVAGLNTKRSGDQTLLKKKKTLLPAPNQKKSLLQTPVRGGKAELRKMNTKVLLPTPELQGGASGAVSSSGGYPDDQAVDIDQVDKYYENVGKIFHGESQKVGISYNKDTQNDSYKSKIFDIKDFDLQDEFSVTIPNKKKPSPVDLYRGNHSDSGSQMSSYKSKVYDIEDFDLSSDLTTPTYPTTPMTPYEEFTTPTRYRGDYSNSGPQANSYGEPKKMGATFHGASQNAGFYDNNTRNNSYESKIYDIDDFNNLNDDISPVRYQNSECSQRRGSYDDGNYSNGRQVEMVPNNQQSPFLQTPEYSDLQYSDQPRRALLPAPRSGSFSRNTQNSLYPSSRSGLLPNPSNGSNNQLPSNYANSSGGSRTPLLGDEPRTVFRDSRSRSPLLGNNPRTVLLGNKPKAPLLGNAPTFSRSGSTCRRSGSSDMSISPQYDIDHYGRDQFGGRSQYGGDQFGGGDSRRVMNSHQGDLKITRRVMNTRPELKRPANMMNVPPQQMRGRQRY